MVSHKLYKFFTSDYNIQQALITSGEGRDYNIVAKSKGLNRRELDVIYSKAMPPIYLSANSDFRNALKFFNVSDEKVGVSFISLAGRDELNRPGRLRAHVLVFDRFIYDAIGDPLFFSEHFVEKDLSGELEVIKINGFDLVSKYVERIKRTFKKMPKVFEELGEEFFVNVISALFQGKKVIIYGGENIDHYSISDEDSEKLSSTLILHAISLTLPAGLRSHIEFSSFSSDYVQESSDIVFSESIPKLNLEKRSLVVDLSNMEIHNRTTLGYIKNYVKHLFEALRKKKFESFLDHVHSFMGSFIDILELYGGREGFKIIREFIEMAQETYNLLKNKEL